MTSLFAEGPTTITGVCQLRQKETDGISAVATELRKLGGVVEDREDGLKIVPGALHSNKINTYDDHPHGYELGTCRMAACRESSSAIRVARQKRTLGSSRISIGCGEKEKPRIKHGKNENLLSRSVFHPVLLFDKSAGR